MVFSSEVIKIMEERKCELRLPNGKVVNFSYAKLKAGIAVTALVLVGAIGGAGYLYHQLADYRSEAADYAAYKQNKAEQQTKLQKLLQDNERMLRDMAEISNLEKKLRRAVIRDVDSSKLGDGTSMVDSTAAKETSANTSYTGKGGPAKMDINGTMAVLTAQNANIKKMLDGTKKSVSELLSEVEGSGGGMSSFPDKWPTDGGTISSNYGVRTGPIEGGYDWHPGLDIAVDFGAPVYATAAGTIEQAGWNGGYGRYVRINHGNGYETAYGHMSGIAVAAGQKVIKGEIIGFVGSTGYSTGPHVHYEVLANGQNIDPFYVLKNR